MTVWKTRRTEAADRAALQQAKRGAGRQRGQPPIPPAVDPATKFATVQASSRHKTRDTGKQGETMNNDLLIPISVLALDVGATGAELARRLADEVLVDDVGRLCVDRDTARALIAEHQARVAASAAAQRDRDQAYRDAIAAQSQPTHARIKALQDHQGALRATGQWDPDMSAFEVMCVGHHASRLDDAGHKFDEMLSAERRGELGSGYRLQPRREN